MRACPQTFIDLLYEMLCTCIESIQEMIGCPKEFNKTDVLFY